MHKFKKLTVSLVLLGGVLFSSESNAIFGWGNKKRTLASDQKVASSSGPVTSWRDRIGGSIMRNVNPCYGPRCVSLVELTECADAQGLQLGVYLLSDDQWFFMQNNKPKFVTVEQRDLDEAGWQAAYGLFQQANQQYQGIIERQNNIQTLLSEVPLDDEAGRDQIRNYQIQLQEMKQQYLLFLAQNGLLDVQKYMQQQQEAQQAVDLIAQGQQAMSVPRADQPKPTDERFIKRKMATVQVMNRDVWSSIQMFARENKYCFETFCYHNCLEDALYTGKDIKNYLRPEEEATMSDVNKMRAMFVLKRSDACSGETTAASKLRAICSYCKEGINGKNVTPIEACSNVNPKEWEKKKSGFGIGF